MKLSSLREQRQYSIEEVAAHIVSVSQEDDYGIAATLREATASADFVDQKTFVAAAVSLGYNASTAAIQFRKSRKFMALLERDDEEARAAIANWNWCKS